MANWNNFCQRIDVTLTLRGLFDCKPTFQLWDLLRPSKLSYFLNWHSLMQYNLRLLHQHQDKPMPSEGPGEN